MLTPSQLALDMSSSARQAQHSLPKALTQPGAGDARTRSCTVSPLPYWLVPAFVQLSRPGEGEEMEGKDGQVGREEIGPPMEMQGAEKPGKARRESSRKKKTS